MTTRAKPPAKDFPVARVGGSAGGLDAPAGWLGHLRRSLTGHGNGKPIAVIVSGDDGDGAAALGGIKEAGGITIAQKLDPATQPDMPESAIAGGCVDFVLSPEGIARKIAEIVVESFRSIEPSKESIQP